MNRSLERAKLMASAIRRAGHEVTSPWVLAPITGREETVNVFQRDKVGTESADILVADVSMPSIGVGMEIMAAYVARKRIVLVRKRGSVTSRMLQHMDRKETIEFDDDTSMAQALEEALRMPA